MILPLSRDRPSQAGFPVLLADVGNRLSEPPHVRLWGTIEVSAVGEVSVAARLENELLDLLETIVEANRARDKAPKLAEADGTFDRLRILVRLSKDMRFISLSSYEHAAVRLGEIGRLLGGWIRGQWSVIAVSCRAAYRLRLRPLDRNIYFPGFRCAGPVAKIQRFRFYRRQNRRGRSCDVPGGCSEKDMLLTVGAAKCYECEY